MARSRGDVVRRQAGVLVWVPPLLLGPALSLPSGVTGAVGGVALVLLTGASAVAAVLTSWPRPTTTSRIALAVLAAAVLGGSFLGSGWLASWGLLGIIAPAVLRGRWLALVWAGAVGGVALAAWLTTHDGGQVATNAFIVALAGATTTAFLRLLATVEELRRTREELARVAVEEERDRLSRDLHDLLGHTLSVMVVKAEAARRLAATDPEQVAGHAADIEQIGRQALSDVREAVTGLRRPTLLDELDSARRALESAGVETSVEGAEVALPADVDAAFAWVLREGTTNVLRHSAAAHCRIELADHGDLRLSVIDDGIGARTLAGDARSSGLDGLRRRLVATGGRLEVDPDADGFRLTAVVPNGARTT